LAHILVKTVLCCVVYNNVHNDTHTAVLQWTVGLGLGSVFANLSLAFCDFVCFLLYSSDYCVLVLSAFVVLDLVCSILRR